MKRKRDEKEDVVHTSTVPLSAGIRSDNTQVILRTGEMIPLACLCRSVSAPNPSFGFSSSTDVIPEAHGGQFGHQWRKCRVISSESSEESHPILPSPISPSMEDEEPWIDRDENDNIRIIDLSKKKKFVTIIIKRMYNYYFYGNLPIRFFFSENHKMSSKISGFIGYFNIDKIKFSGQYCFAVIEPTDGPPKLIKHFIPVNHSEIKHLTDIDHGEEQCIWEIKKEIKGKEKMIKAIYIFTKLFPCVGRKGRDPCISQLVNFSEEMIYNFKIDLYVTFQDFYAIGNIVKELKLLIKDEDLTIKHQSLWLKEKVKAQHRRSTFTAFHRHKKHKTHSKTITNHIKTQMLKLNLLNRRDISSILTFAIEFPNKEMTYDEFKSFGEQQADKLKTHVKTLNASEEITDEVCRLFNSKWCELLDEEYDKFIYEKVSDYMNSFADNLVYDNIKAITDLNLERVVI
ncbi:uncharacterized protein [Pseudorasbora parva]